MSAEIINLRRARKQRERDRKTAEAAENRALFGRTKSERELEELSRARAELALDGHVRAATTPDPTDDAGTRQPTGPSRPTLKAPPKSPQ